MYYLNYYMQPDRNWTAINGIERVKGRIATRVTETPEILEGRFRAMVKPTRKLMNDILRYDTAFRAGDVQTEYSIYRIPKHSGGYRTIEAPSAQLKSVQKHVLNWLQKEIKVLPHDSAHGFVPHRNCATSLQVHQQYKSRWFLKIDIKNFFTSISTLQVHTALLSHPYIQHLEDMHMLQLRELLKVVTFGGRLPQGAPTSPILANIVMIPYDYAIREYCKQHDLIYTRYADDILISSKYQFDWREVQAFVQDTLPQNIRLNNRKTRYSSFNGSNWNLGLMYNNSYNITIGHQKKNQLKVRVFQVTQSEVVDFEELYKLRGEIGYAKFIEPDYQNYDRWLQQLRAVEVHALQWTPYRMY